MLSVLLLPPRPQMKRTGPHPNTYNCGWASCYAALPFRVRGQTLNCMNCWAVRESSGGIFRLASGKVVPAVLVRETLWTKRWLFRSRTEPEGSGTVNLRVAVAYTSK